MREVSRWVLSVICRALEAGPPEPEEEELAAQESVDNRRPRGTLLTEGEEMTYKGT